MRSTWPVRIGSSLVAAAVAALTLGAGGAAAWEIDPKGDEFGRSVFARTYYADGIGTTDSFAKAFAAGDDYELIIRCRDKELHIYIVHEWLYDDPSIDYSDTALVVFGSKPAVAWPVWASASGNAVFFGRESAFAKRLTGYWKLAVRIQASLTHTARFKVAGLAAHRAKFKSAGCAF